MQPFLASNLTVAKNFLNDSFVFVSHKSHVCLLIIVFNVFAWTSKTLNTMINKQTRSRWWRSIVVRTSVLAGELSLSCARLMDGYWTTLWVRRPLSVNQQGQLSLPSLRGRLNE